VQADLAEGTAAVIPIDNVHHVRVAPDAMDVIEYDEMGGKAPFEFVVVLFVQVGVVDIQEGRAGSGDGRFQIIIEVADIGADKIGAAGFDAIAKEFADHAVEFAVIDGCPEGVLRARMKVSGEKVKVGSEVVGESEEPELVGWADVQDAFESQGACCLVDRGGGVEMNGSHCGLSICVEGEHEAGIGEGVVLQGQVGECCIATEIGIAPLVDLERTNDISF
jgi:hypothetical protein